MSWPFLCAMAMFFAVCFVGGYAVGREAERAEWEHLQRRVENYVAGQETNDD